MTALRTTFLPSTFLVEFAPILPYVPALVR